MTQITIPVEGMTCGGCVKSVERALGNQAGVSSAKASLEGKNVAVEFDAAAISKAQLEAAIQKAGFSVPA
ncbi:MAG: heavy-metal-associated domain-containing protein [Rhodospirillaceae bacterium]|nr:heavy-metal-associated domain-containing protein [Rhodospirillaceae bacterium]